MNATKQNKIVKNTVILYLRMLFTMGVAFYTTRLTLEALGVDDFGTFNIISSLILLFGVVSQTLATTTQRFFAFELGTENSKGLRKVFNLAIILHILFATILLILLETGGLYFLLHGLNIPDGQEKTAFWLYQFSVCSLLLAIIQVPYNSILLAREQMDYFALFSILETIYKLVIVIFLSFCSHHRLLIYGGLLLSSSIIFTLARVIFCQFRFPECRGIEKWTLHGAREIFSYSTWNLLGQVGLISTTQGINILLNQFFGVAINAARGIAGQVGCVLDTFFSNYIQAVVPQITQRYAQCDWKAFRRLLYLSSRYSFLLLWLIGLPVLLEMEFLLKIWLYNIPAYSVIFCTLTIINSMVRALSGTLVFGILATGRIRNYYLIISAILLLNIPISYYLLHIGYGPESVMIVTVLISGLENIVRILCLYKQKLIRIDEYWQLVVTQCLRVSSLSLLLPLYLRLVLSEGIFRFLLVAGSACCGVLLTTYLLGIDKADQIKITTYLKNCDLKFFHKDYL